MQFIGSFRTFDPIDGYFRSEDRSVVVIADHEYYENSSSIFPVVLDSMADRAREIIAGRTRDEINAALDTVNFMLYLSVHEILDVDGETTSIERVENGVIAGLIVDGAYTPAQLLKSQIPLYDITGNDQLRNAKWEEYFAVLALAALGDIHRFRQLDGTLSDASVGWAAQSMEALVIAENPALLVEGQNQLVKEQMRIRNQRSAIRGHAELNEWKQRFREWVGQGYLPNLQGKRPNKRDAARQFKSLVVDPHLENHRVPALENAKDPIRLFADSLANHQSFSDQ